MRLTQKVILILCFIGMGVFDAYGQIMYSTRYKSAIQLEGFGVSPIVSVNYEYLPVRFRRSFISTRLGFGYMPGMKNPPSGLSGNGGFSVPVGMNYNFLLKNLRKRTSARLMNKCKSLPPKVESEMFFEIGGAYSLVIYPGEVRHFYFSNFAIRQQVIINIPPKPRVLYAKLSLNPAMIRDRTSGKYEPKLIYGDNESGRRFFGGFGIGMSI